MLTIKRLLCFCFLIAWLVSCQILTNAPTSEPEPAVVDATSTNTPIPASPDKPTASPTPESTETLEPTNTSEPEVQEPFLPAELVPIDASNISELRWIQTIPAQEIYSLAFSQLGDRLATVSEHWQDRSDSLSVWDMLTGDQILFLEDLDSPWMPDFSPDGSQLFIPYGDQGVDIYDLTQAQQTGEIELSANWYAFSPDGNSIALGTYRGNPDESDIQLVDLASEQVLQVYTMPGMVQSLQFSPDGSLLTAGFHGPNHTRELVWEISSQERVADLVDNDYRLVFSADNRLAATAKSGKVDVFLTDGWVLRNSYAPKDPNSNAKPSDFSAHGDILAVEDRYTIVFLDVSTSAELASLPDECDIRFSPNGIILITWCYQGDLKIWGVTP